MCTTKTAGEREREREGETERETENVRTREREKERERERRERDLEMTKSSDITSRKTLGDSKHNADIIAIFTAEMQGKKKEKSPAIKCFKARQGK